VKLTSAGMRATFLVPALGQSPGGIEIDLRRDLWVGILWLLVALVSRYALLSHWSLWGDEYYTFADARKIFTSARRESGLVYPLFFVLTKGALLWLPGSLSLEFKLRCIPALAGAMAVWVLFRGTRSVLPPLERHLVAALAAFSPWLLFLSQWARFYSQLCLLSSAAVFLLLRALETNSTVRACLALVCVILAILTHPSAVLLLCSLILAGILVSWLGYVRGHRALFPLYAMFVLAILLLITALWRFDLLEKTVGRKLQGGGGGLQSVVELFQGIIYNLGLSVAALSVLGMGVLYRKDRRLFHFVWVGAGLPLAAVLLLAARGAEMDQRYLIPEVALMFIPAAAMLGEMARRARAAVRGGGAAVIALGFVPFLPSLVSHYVDGNSHDLRSAAGFIEEHWQEGDAVICENNAVMAIYCRKTGASNLVEAPPETREEHFKYVRLLKECARLWVVIPDDFQFRPGPEASFHHWAFTQGRLMQELYPPRIDYHQNRLLIFEIDPRHAVRWNPY